MKNNYLLTFSKSICILFLIILFGCQQSEKIVPQETPKINGDYSSGETQKLSVNEILLKSKLKQTALILTELTHNIDICKEILDGVAIKFDGDENILFKDLLDRQNSTIYKSNGKIGSTSFADKFREVTKSEKYYQSSYFIQQNARQSGENNLEKFLLENNIQVYWPYHQMWDGKTTPTVSFHPIDNADENVGYKIMKKGSIYEYEEVQVDDDYAYSNPVWIISQNDMFKFSRLQKLNSSATKNARTAAITEVKIGMVKSKKHWDGLFDGGPDFYFIRATAAVNVNGGAFFQVPAGVTRYAVRKDIFESKNVVWDGDWNDSKTTQVIGCYEWDAKGESTITGSATSKIDDNTSITFGLSQKVTSEHPVLFQNDMTKAYFLNSSSRNLGDGILYGFSVRRAGNEVYYTMPYGNF